MDVISSYWIWFAAAGAVVVGGILIWLLLRRVRGPRGGMRHAVRSIALDRLEDVLLPDGMGGQIHLEQIVLTTRGIIVLNIKQLEGVVFASDQMNEWTVMGPGGRRTMPNPQGDLYDRVAAVKQLVRDVSVSGFVLFPAAADFSKGRPKDIALPAELVEQFGKPSKAEIQRHIEAYAPHWDRIKEAAEPAASRPPRIN